MQPRAQCTSSLTMSDCRICSDIINCTHLKASEKSIIIINQSIPKTFSKNEKVYDIIDFIDDSMFVPEPPPSYFIHQL